MRLLLSLGLLFAVFAGCTPSPAPLVSEEFAIASGAAADEDRAVASLLFAPVDRAGRRAIHGICSASLIAPNFLLTARHCVTDMSEESVQAGRQPTPYRPGDMFATWDREVTESSSPSLVTHFRAHPTDDVAVVEIAETPNLEPYALNGSAPERWVGTEGRQVGYGLTAIGKEDSGIRRSGSVHLRDAVDWPGIGKTMVIENKHGHQLCPGDSGGPTLVPVNGREVVAGVASYLIGECQAQGSVGLAVRADAYTDFILDYVEDRGGIPPEVQIAEESGGCSSASGGGIFAALVLFVVSVVASAYGRRRRRIRFAPLRYLHDDAYAGSRRPGGAE
jgi:hypothetical protein